MKGLPRLRVEVGNVLSDDEGLEDDMTLTEFEGRDLAIGIDVLQVPVRAGHAQIKLDDIVLLVGFGKGKDGPGSVGAIVGVVECELGDGHCWFLLSWLLKKKVVRRNVFALIEGKERGHSPPFI